MHQIAISDAAYNTFTTLANKRGQSVQEFIEALAAQEAWEDHAAENYDRYQERAAKGERGQVMAEEEFFRSLDDTGGQ